MTAQKKDQNLSLRHYRILYYRIDSVVQNLKKLILTNSNL